MRVDGRIKLIWWIRGALGARGLLVLTANPANPATDHTLRENLLAAVNWNQGRHPWADHRGIIRHAPGQTADEYPADVYSWDQVWQLIAPGITDDRIAELRAAWDAGRELRAQYAWYRDDDRTHLACCAFFSPPPAIQTGQLDLLDLIGAS